MNSEIYQSLELLQNLVIQKVTDGFNEADDDQYKTLRNQLLNNPKIGKVLPECVRKCRDLPQIWSFIKSKDLETYHKRRVYVWGSFSETFEILESLSGSPSDELVLDTLQGFDTEYVAEVWQEALRRREENPEAAITASRTLLESVCKHILDEVKADYSPSENLPKLYYLTSSELNLAPEQHIEKVFKQILGGCNSVVNGFSTFR